MSQAIGAKGKSMAIPAAQYAASSASSPNTKNQIASLFQSSASPKLTDKSYKLCAARHGPPIGIHANNILENKSLVETLNSCWHDLNLSRKDKLTDNDLQQKKAVWVIKIIDLILSLGIQYQVEQIRAEYIYHFAVDLLDITQKMTHPLQEETPHDQIELRNILPLCIYIYNQKSADLNNCLLNNVLKKALLIFQNKPLSIEYKRFSNKLITDFFEPNSYISQVFCNLGIEEKSLLLIGALNFSHNACCDPNNWMKLAILTCLQSLKRKKEDFVKLFNIIMSRIATLEPRVQQLLIKIFHESFDDRDVPNQDFLASFGIVRLPTPSPTPSPISGSMHGRSSSSVFTPSMYDKSETPHNYEEDNKQFLIHAYNHGFLDIPYTKPYYHLRPKFMTKIITEELTIFEVVGAPEYILEPRELNHPLTQPEIALFPKITSLFLAVQNFVCSKDNMNWPEHLAIKFECLHKIISSNDFPFEHLERTEFYKLALFEMQHYKLHHFLTNINCAKHFAQVCHQTAHPEDFIAYLNNSLPVQTISFEKFTKIVINKVCRELNLYPDDNETKFLREGAFMRTLHIARLQNVDNFIQNIQKTFAPAQVKNPDRKENSSPVQSEDAAQIIELLDSNEQSQDDNRTRANKIKLRTLFNHYFSQASKEEHDKIATQLRQLDTEVKEKTTQEYCETLAANVKPAGKAHAYEFIKRHFNWDAAVKHEMDLYYNWECQTAQKMVRNYCQQNVDLAFLLPLVTSYMPFLSYNVIKLLNDTYFTDKQINNSLTAEKAQINSIIYYIETILGCNETDGDEPLMCFVVAKRNHPTSPILLVFESFNDLCSSPSRPLLLQNVQVLDFSTPNIHENYLTAALKDDLILPRFLKRHLASAQIVGTQISIQFNHFLLNILKPLLEPQKKSLSDEMLQTLQAGVMHSLISPSQSMMLPLREKTQLADFLETHFQDYYSSFEQQIQQGRDKEREDLFSTVISSLNRKVFRTRAQTIELSNYFYVSVLNPLEKFQTRSDSESKMQDEIVKQVTLCLQQFLTEGPNSSNPLTLAKQDYEAVIQKLIVYCTATRQNNFLYRLICAHFQENSEFLKVMNKGIDQLIQELLPLIHKLDAHSLIMYTEGFSVIKHIPQWEMILLFYILGTSALSMSSAYVFGVHIESVRDSSNIKSWENRSINFFRYLQLAFLTQFTQLIERHAKGPNSNLYKISEKLKLSIGQCFEGECASIIANQLTMITRFNAHTNQHESLEKFLFYTPSQIVVKLPIHPA